MPEIIDILKEGPLKGPNGIKFHTIQAIFEELFDSVDVKELKLEIINDFLKIFTDMLKNQDKLTIQKIWDTVILNGNIS